MAVTAVTNSYPSICAGSSVGGGQLRAGDALGDGRHLLVKFVGRGGFAVVWDAYDRTKQQRVAIKVLHSHLAEDRIRREQFFRDTRATEGLRHPAVVRVLEPEDGRYFYFVVELLGGGNLREAVLEKRLEKSMTTLRRSPGPPLHTPQKRDHLRACGL